ncbi:lysine-specific demethylase 2B-like [Elysia marginata]|uniref:Lysine-specific demethylase 2B-like n=1 Tax=Elysia marginata TaxID=1093978 RepID=A0AAV4EE00_9GAST|nr:lysine-specific demethylase 2B-like [Elysia marginata]
METMKKLLCMSIRDVKTSKLNSENKMLNEIIRVDSSFALRSQGAGFEVSENTGYAGLDLGILPSPKAGYHLVGETQHLFEQSLDGGMVKRGGLQSQHQLKYLAGDGRGSPYGGSSFHPYHHHHMPMAASTSFAGLAGAQSLSPSPALSSSSSSSSLLHTSAPVGVNPQPLSMPMSSSTPSSQSIGAVAGGHLQSCHDGSRFFPSRVKKEEDTGSSEGGRDGNPPPGPSPEKLRWGTDYAPKVSIKNYVVRPAPPLNIPEFVTLNDGNRHPLPHPLWLAVFRWLPQSDLARLCSVCRTFDCWVLDPTLWLSLDLSRRTLQPVHLRGIVLRQPRALKMASTVVSFPQLSWLVARLPGLKHLDLSNLSWASIGALCSADCPLLRSLDLSWATGIRDLCFRELASPPVNLKPGQRNISRLARLERLSLTGTDINDQSLKTISLHLPRLTALDLTCCMRVTDRGIRALVQMSSAGPCRLRELRLVKCVQLTERCLEALASCVELRYLALTDNPAISQEACVRFSRSYRHRTLRAHAHGILSV